MLRVSNSHPTRGKENRIDAKRRKVKSRRRLCLRGAGYSNGFLILKEVLRAFSRACAFVTDARSLWKSDSQCVTQICALLQKTTVKFQSRLHRLIREVLANHRWQSQQSRMELGLRVDH